MAKDKEDMWARMQTFAAAARSLAPKCTNEEQTKISLINPYLEILGYDVRDPDICRFEFTADIGKSGEKVDYAIMRDGKPAIFIEAKAATRQFSEHDPVPGQLQRYFISEEAEFAVLTNGVVWNWYTSYDGPKLEATPFKTHDVRHPEQADMDWLWSISGYVSDSRRATRQAEAERMRSAFREWIRTVRHSPNDGFIRFLLSDLKKDGLNFGIATQARIEESREHFRSTFENYIDGETSRVLKAAREQIDEEDKPEIYSKETDSLTVVQEDRNSLDRPAWRIRGEDWRVEKNGRTLQLAVAQWLASIDIRGADAFYQSIIDTWGDRFFLNTVPEGQDGAYREVEPGRGYWTRIHLSNSDRLSRLKRWCDQTQKPDGGTVLWNVDIEVQLPVRSKG